MLIRDRRLGAALAQALGMQSTVLMRGHGSTVVAASVRLAVYRAVYAEINARLQCQAVTMGGEVTYLTMEEAAAAALANEGQLGRAWQLWAQQVAQPPTA